MEKMQFEILLNEMKAFRADVNARFDRMQLEMNTRFEKVDARFDRIEKDVAETKFLLGKIDKKLDGAYEQTAKTTEEIYSLKQRVSDLEKDEGPTA